MSEWSYLKKLAVEGIERIMSGEVVLATPVEELGECLFEDWYRPYCIGFGLSFGFRVLGFEILNSKLRTPNSNSKL